MNGGIVTYRRSVTIREIRIKEQNILDYQEWMRLDPSGSDRDYPVPEKRGELSEIVTPNLTNDNKVWARNTLRTGLIPTQSTQLNAIRRLHQLEKALLFTCKSCAWIQNRKNPDEWNIFGLTAFEVCLKLVFAYYQGSDWLVVYAGCDEVLSDCIMWFARGLITQRHILRAMSKRKPGKFLVTSRLLNAECGRPFW